MKSAIIAIMLAVLLVVAGCGAEGAVVGIQKKGDTGPIKVGVVMPLTGQIADIGIGSRESIEMAVEEIHATGGINGRALQLIIEDGGCDPKIASNAANKLINVDKVKYIIGGLCSAESTAMTALTRPAQVLQISPCSSNPALTEAGPWFFRDYPSDSYQGVFGAEYAYNTLGARKAGIIFTNDDWGVGIKNTFAQKFKELGGEVVAVEAMEKPESDARTQLTKLKSAGADFIYAPTFVDNAVVILRQKKELNFDVPVLDGDAGDDENIIKNAGNAAEGFMFTTVKVNPDSQTVAKYKQKTGHDFKLCGYHAYDTPHVLAQALRQAGDNPDQVRQALHKISHQGLTGTISFDANGDLVGAKYDVKVVKNGKFVTLA